MCPCIGLRHGAFLLALMTYLAVESKLFFGLSVVEMVHAARMGGVYSFTVVSIFLCVTLLGLCWVVSGYRATRTHYEDIEGMSVAYSAGVIALCWWLLQNALIANDLLIELARAFAVAWMTGNAANLYLQLRGLFPRKSPVRQTSIRAPDALLYEMRAMITRQAAQIHQLTEERNQLAFDLSRKQGAGELETILKYPGVDRAVLAALHPDRARTDDERKLQTVRFQTASAVFERIGIRR